MAHSFFKKYPDKNDKKMGFWFYLSCITISDFSTQSSTNNIRPFRTINFPPLRYLWLKIFTFWLSTHFSLFNPSSVMKAYCHVLNFHLSCSVIRLAPSVLYFFSPLPLYFFFYRVWISCSQEYFIESSDSTSHEFDFFTKILEIREFPFQRSRHLNRNLIDSRRFSPSSLMVLFSRLIQNFLPLT